MVAKREQRTKRNILTASLATKGLVSTRQIIQPECPWQRHNCQVFKFQINTVWVIKGASSFYKKTSVACETAGTSQPSPGGTCRGWTPGCGLRTLEAYL